MNIGVSPEIIFYFKAFNCWLHLVLPAVQSSTVMTVTNNMAGPQEGSKLSLAESHHTDVVLQSDQTVRTEVPGNP